MNLKREPLAFNDFPFIIPINKPAGITSFDCIRRMRPRLFECLGKGKGRRKLKIGHFGTLDPFADGILLVGTGKAMRLMNLVQESLKKRYSAIGFFGEKTITGDLEGDVIKAWEDAFDSELQKKIAVSLDQQVLALKDEYLQVPPYFSAVKHEGKPLYEYARNGVFIDKPPVTREVYDLDVRASKEPQLYDLVCSVSSGTYIRGLWQDLLKDFGKLGHLKSLSRIGYGPVKQSDCVDLEDFCAESGGTFPHILAWDFLELPTLEFSKRDAGAFLQGGFLPLGGQLKDPYYWVRFDGHYLGLAERFEENGSAKVKAMINFY